jgi:hypothetical protein
MRINAVAGWLSPKFATELFTFASSVTPFQAAHYAAQRETVFGTRHIEKFTRDRLPHGRVEASQATPSFLKVNYEPGGDPHLRTHTPRN